MAWHTTRQLQCKKKKETFRPETGPQFPKNDKNPKVFGTNLFLVEFSLLFLVFRFFWQAMQNSDHHTMVQTRFAPDP